jgi:SAM-dependent methyltransferase
MNNFIKYAKYYNLFYKVKDYRKEAAYVDRLIKLFSGRHGKSLLDIGCGTGNHDFWFLKKGYQVTGIDRSPAMIDVARDKMHLLPQAEFYVADANRFVLKKKFDVAVSLFHVMSYLTTNDMVISSLKNIHRHLKAGGLFIFDFWYGPTVLIQKPALRIRSFHEKGVFIKRSGVPKVNFNDNTVDINYKFMIKNNNAKNIFNERHLMRYFFLPELQLMMDKVGFKTVKAFRWLSLKEAPSENHWSGVIVARK